MSATLPEVVVLFRFGSWGHDVSLRIGGLTLAVIGTACCRWLAMISTAPQHETAAADLLLATAGFLGLSVGIMLVCIGSHIHDRIMISDRWAENSAGPQDCALTSDREKWCCR